jgi:hypothetical protein
MQIDITKSALENLVLQVVDDNTGLALTANQVTAGAVAVFAGSPQNSQVTLTAVEGQGFSGSKLVKYSRVGINGGVAVPVTSVDVLMTDTYPEVQAKVALAMGLRADELDFSEWTPPASTSSPGNIGVSPKATSLLYQGGGVFVAVVGVAPELEDGVTVDELSGFNPVA